MTEHLPPASTPSMDIISDIKKEVQFGMIDIWDAIHGVKPSTESGVEGIKCQTNKDWSNWGANLTKHLARIFYPKSAEEIRRIVKWAKTKNFRVRCSGYSHSWSEIFPDNDQ